jgi:hypothetical protein
MVLSHFQETVRCAATKELPTILWHRKVHHGVRKSPPLLHVITQICAVQTTSYLSKIHLNAIHVLIFWLQ